MITYVSRTTNLYGRDCAREEIYGLSEDEKPMDCPNASVFYEMDSKKVYMFDEKYKRWLEQ